MKQIKIMTIALAVILFIAGAIYALRKANEDKENQNVGTNALQTQSNKEGDVEVTVLPETRIGGVRFKVTMDTHSVNLDYDMVKLSELVDERGIIYKASGWSGDPPSGHHRNGVLKFDFPVPASKSLILKIKEVGGVKERFFKWEL